MKTHSGIIWRVWSFQQVLSYVVNELEMTYVYNGFWTLVFQLMAVSNLWGTTFQAVIHQWVWDLRVNKFFFNLLIYFISWSQFPLSLLIPFPHPTYLPTRPPNPLLLCSESDRPQHGCQHRMTWHVEVGLNFSPYIKAEQCNPLWGIGS